MLLNLPQCHPQESPSSWLTRISISQGERLSVITNLLGLQDCYDIDLRLASAPPQDFDQFGIDISALVVSRRVFSTLMSGGLSSDRFLLRSSRGRQKYRYCPVCLRTGYVPTIPIHWRFAAWRYCPLHMCLMEENCHNCHAELLLPVSQLSSGPMMRGVDNLGRCMNCSDRLWVEPVVIEWNTFAEIFGMQIVRQFVHGRALLSALYHGEVRMDKLKTPLSPSVLVCMDENQEFLNDFGFVSSAYVRETIKLFSKKIPGELIYPDIRLGGEIRPPCTVKAGMRRRKFKYAGIFG